MNLYQKITSHLPVLIELIFNFKIDDVLEFGSGFASTGLFCKECNRVFTIEMQNEDWYFNVKKKYKSYLKDKLTLEYIPTEPNDDGTEAIDIIPTNKKYDMIFVDGARDSRWNIIQYSHDNNLSDIIVCHDSEELCYKYDQVKINKEWKRIDIKIYEVWTTVFTNKKDIIKFLNDMDYVKLKKKYKNIIGKDYD